jgi:hypothetical protein
MRKFLGILGASQDAASNMTGELELQLPQLAAEVSPAQIDPKKLESWLENLPKANLGEMSRQVYQALIGLNRAPIDRRQRQAAIDILEHQINYITSSLKKHYQDKPLPLSAKSRKIVQLVERLYAELAISYKRNIMDQLHGSKRIDNHVLAMNFIRVMHYLNNVLLNSYATYSRYPAGIWQELNSMYRYAIDNKFSDLEIDAPDNSHMTTITKEYARINLLVLACPYQLRQGEITIINNNMRPYVDKIKMEPLDRIKHNYPFIIDTNGDVPPTFAEFTVPRPSLRLLGMDTSALVVFMKSRLEEATQIGKKSSIDNLPRDLYMRLMMHWGASRKRSFPRSKNDSIVNAAIGLSAAHYFLNGEAGFHKQVTKSKQEGGSRPTRTGRDDERVAINAQFSSTDMAMVSDQDSDVWHNLYTILPEMHSPEKVVTFRSDHVDSESHQLHPLKIGDTSAGGFLLYCDRGCTVHAKIGDLILIDDSAESDSAQWTLASIRRLQYQDNLLEIGVEMLTPSAIPVAIQTAVDKEKKSSFLRALLLPEIRSLNQAPSLILPNLPYQSDQRIVVYINDNVSQIQLTDLIENTGNYCRYHFKNLSTDSSHARDSEVTLDAGEFQSLWTSI